MILHWIHLNTGRGNNQEGESSPISKCEVSPAPDALFWDAPEDDAYLLQRYFLHADIHMGEHLRLFTQLQSSLEDGRNGGPRPTDKDKLDLHQAFLDVKFDVGGDGSFVLRSFRRDVDYLTAWLTCKF